ncbi:MAG: MBL fold metallo-hydrolase, partial [Gammaproteobacteria bacterium]|nr:MBL fold metallo-hydrolase [Gammaproteobacteria bacterium]
MPNLKIVLALSTLLIFSCSKAPEIGDDEKIAKAESMLAQMDAQEVYVSDAVRTHHRKIKQELDFNNKADYAAAERGFIATMEKTEILNANGMPAYDIGAFDFIQGEAPDSVNPSLWRQGELTAKHGLFKVMDGIYQVRNFDLSNISFIRGESGWIVVDPLISKEPARAAYELVKRELGDFPVSAVIYTHSHADHFGGVRGLISEEDVANGVKIIAPLNFTLETVSESILAGNQMTRRASYMFGSLLPRSPTGSVGVGLGPAISSGGMGMIAPSDEITHTGQKMTVDGIEFEFLLALGAEAPSEFMFYLPQFKAFCQAEIINHTLHNLYTPRGAKVRDGRIWSKYIDEAIVMFADKTEVSFGSHHWPTWGQEKIVDFWSGQRDLYRFIHDQTLRLANHGYTMHEIPELLNMPDGIAKSFANRDYYGTLSHNSKAQYQLYFGYFDGNPANLDPLSPVDEGKKFVEYMGGADKVIAKAQGDFDKGEFRFAATALNHVIFAQPDNKQAADLLAKTYQQLAYMAESGSWRNFYLSAAVELQNGIIDLPTPKAGGPDLVKAVPLDLFFDTMAVKLDANKAKNKNWRFNFELTDTGEKALMIVSNGTLHHRMNASDENANATIKMTRAALDLLSLKQKTFRELSKEGMA